MEKVGQCAFACPFEHLVKFALQLFSQPQLSAETGRIPATLARQDINLNKSTQLQWEMLQS